METESFDESNERLNQIRASFQEYGLEFDAEHDLYEKLVKKSRDVTIESKRIIFLLHRQNTTESEEKTLIDAKKRLKEAYKMIIYGIGSLLISEDVHHYLPAFTAGMQEFIEAIAFYYYIKESKVISLQEINDGIFLFDKDINLEDSDNKKKLPMSTLLNPIDYILGLADLTGELMRKCVSSGNLEEPFRLRSVLKDIYSAFLLIGNNGSRELTRKTSTLKASLQKVENACYTIRVRGSEMENLMANNEGMVRTDRLNLDDVFNAPEMPLSIDDAFI